MKAHSADRATGREADERRSQSGEALEARVSGLIEPALVALGYELVRVKLIARPGGQTLQVMAEPLPEPPEAGPSAPRRAMALDDCTAISRAIEPLLDVEDPILGAYDLEVSSPGLDRPLQGAAQFARFAGFDARVELRAPRDGRRRFAGRIDGAGDGVVRLTVDGQQVELPLGDVEKAKIVITDALLKAARGGRI